MLGRKKKNQHQCVKEDTQFLSACGFHEAAAPQLRKISVGDPWCSTYMCRYGCQLPFLFSSWEKATLSNHSALNKSWQAAQPAPLLSPLSHHFLKAPAQVKSVALLFPLYLYRVQKQLPEIPLTIDTFPFKLCH